MEWAIPLSALIVSIATLVFAAITRTHKSGRGDVSSAELKLEKMRDRIETLEDKVQQSNTERARMIAENVELMRRVIKKNGTT